MKLESNIWKYYLFEILWSLVFFFPIFQLFYLARGLTITQIAFIGAAFSIAKILTEVPSGILADKWGRKKTLFLSQLFLLIDMTIIIFFNNFWLYLLAGVFSGLWFSFYSGTAIAFFYDTLKGLKREKEYEKLAGKLHLFTSIAGFLAALGAGYLFEISITLPYILTVVSIILSLIVILTFKEPALHKSSEEEDVLQHFKSSIKKITQNKNIGFITIYSAFLIFSLSYVFHYGQIYLKDISVPIVLFGVIFAFRSIIEGGGGFLADRIKNIFSYRFIFSFSLIFSLAIIFGLSYLNNYFGVLVFLASFFIVGSFRIIQRGYLHKRVESNNRATVDSMASFLISVVMVIFGPIAGKIADLYSIQTSFFVLGVILLIYSVYYFIFNFNKKELFER